EPPSCRADPSDFFFRGPPTSFLLPAGAVVTEPLVTVSPAGRAAASPCGCSVGPAVQASNPKTASRFNSSIIQGPRLHVDWRWRSVATDRATPAAHPTLQSTHPAIRLPRPGTPRPREAGIPVTAPASEWVQAARPKPRPGTDPHRSK